MYITIITKEYDNVTSSNYTDYDNITSSNDNLSLSNCTFNENDIDINIPSLLLTIPCGLSFLCMLSLMIYTIIKPLFSKK